MFDWISSAISQLGYPGIALLMFAENIFPPIPSEFIMPLAGFTAASGDFNLALVILAGTVGSVLGALPWYYAGVFLGGERIERIADRYGRWITLSRDEVESATRWFNHHGHKAVFLGRMVPTVRTLISLPAGITRMGLLPFLIYSTLGTALWTALLGGAGYLLGQRYRLVADYLNPISTLVIFLLVLIYIYRLATHSSPR